MTSPDDITPITDRWASDEDDPGYLVVEEPPPPAPE